MKLLFSIIVLISILSSCGGENKENTTLDGSSVTLSSNNVSESDEILRAAFNNKQSNLQVQGTGTVIRLLSDDLSGSKHQRFILKLAIDQTLLVSHNIDLAARIDSLQINDIVSFYGEYEWSSDGGVVHWTHDDPNGIHKNGWLKHKGITFH